VLFCLALAAGNQMMAEKFCPLDSASEMMLNQERRFWGLRSLTSLRNEIF
jgi:hypothetical protein